MRRNTEEVKSELFSRLDEYNKNRRRRRRVAASCLTVALVAAVTVVAVPSLVANSREDYVPTSKGETEASAATDGAMDVIITNSSEGLYGGEIPSQNGSDNDKYSGLSSEVIEGIPGEPTWTESAGIIFRDRGGLSGEDAAPIISAYEALELEKIESFSGNVILTFNIEYENAGSVVIELTDRDELLIRIGDYMAEPTFYTAGNIHLLKDALKDAGVLE